MVVNGPGLDEIGHLEAFGERGADTPKVLERCHHDLPSRRNCSFAAATTAPSSNPNRGNVRRPFDSAVPAPVVVAAVAVALAVGLVVLALVGNEIVQREAVLARF